METASFACLQSHDKFNIFLLNDWGEDKSIIILYKSSVSC